MEKYPFRRLIGRRRSSGLWLDKAGKEQASIRIEPDSEVERQRAMIGLTVDDLKLLKAVRPLVEEHIDEITDAFYRSVLNVGVLEKIIREHSTVERLKLTLRGHIVEMFGGSIDAGFIEKRLKIAKVHQTIGLEPKWYMGAFQSLQNTFLDVVGRHVRDREESLQICKAIGKLLNFEQQIVLDAYEKENWHQREQAYEKVKAELQGKITLVSQELASLAEETSATVQEAVAGSSEVRQSFVRSLARIY